MFIWNFRLIRVHNPGEKFYYTIGEVHYDEDGKPTSWTEACLLASSVKDMGWTLKKIEDGYNKPTLFYYSGPDILTDKEIKA
jgi:hypothetical protein